MSNEINEINGDLNAIDDGTTDADYADMPKVARTQTTASRPYFDPAADYTERTGRYLSLSERMQERSRYSQQTQDLI
jgi:hypothetical protein